MTYLPQQPIDEDPLHGRLASLFKLRQRLFALGKIGNALIDGMGLEEIYIKLGGTPEPKKFTRPLMPLPGMPPLHIPIGKDRPELQSLEDRIPFDARGDFSTILAAVWFCIHRVDFQILDKFPQVRWVSCRICKGMRDSVLWAFKKAIA